VILYVVDRLDNRRKGLGLLREALAGLKDQNQFPPCYSWASGCNPRLGMPHVSLGLVSDERILSLAYSSADVFVCPSLQDNLPNHSTRILALWRAYCQFQMLVVSRTWSERGLQGTWSPLATHRGYAKRSLASFAIQRAVLSWRPTVVKSQFAEYSLEIQARRYISLY